MASGAWMRLMAVAIVALGATARVWAQGAARAEPKPSEHKDKPGAKEGAGEPVTLKFAPRTLTVNANMQFDELSGELIYEQGNADLGFTLKSSSPMAMTTLSNVTITRFETDAGEDLARHVERLSYSGEGDVVQGLTMRPGQDGGGGEAEQGFGFSFALPAGEKGYRKVVRLEGTAEVVVRSGAVSKLVMKNLKYGTSGRVRVDGAGDDWVRVRARTDGVDVISSPTLARRMLRAYFFSPEGTLLQADMSHQARLPGTTMSTVVHLSGQMPEKFSMVLVLCAEAKKQTVKFEGKNIVVTGEESDAHEGEVVLKPEVIEDGFSIEDVMGEKAPAEKDAERKSGG